MCPKLKPEKVILHRFELQQTERDALEMVAASITARNTTASIQNLTKGVGNLIDPILSASVAGVAAALGIIAWWEMQDRETVGPPKPPADSGYTEWEQVPGVVWGGPESPEAEAQRKQKESAFKAKLSQFRNAISTELTKLTRTGSL
jgi:hypothetical protein